MPCYHRQKTGFQCDDPDVAGLPYLERFGLKQEVATSQADISAKAVKQFKDNLVTAMSSMELAGVAVDKG